MLKQDSIPCEQYQKVTLHRVETLSSGLWCLLFLFLLGSVGVFGCRYVMNSKILLIDWGLTISIILLVVAGGVFVVHNFVILPYLYWRCQVCGRGDR
ncbi:MAG: hypothetical protein O3B13_01260 [Planctomycetota bacterium]|nr:hypothetical protein [Planctomycetota bacterium]